MERRLGLAAFSMIARVVLVLVLAGSVASAGDDPKVVEAEAMLQHGVGQYEAGKYDEAIREYLVGQAVYPLPAFLYALGQAERKRGDCARAVHYYKAFLATSPTDAQRVAVGLQIDRCQQALAAKPPPVVERPIEKPIERPVVEAPAVVIARPTPPGPRWYRDPAGGALVGTGAALTLAGGVLLGLGEPRDARSSYDALVDARSGSWKVYAGAGCLGVGVALLIGGASRWAIVGVRSKRAEARP